MNILARVVEMCAVWGCNCASMVWQYQPQMPEYLK